MSKRTERDATANGAISENAAETTVSNDARAANKTKTNANMTLGQQLEAEKQQNKERRQKARQAAAEARGKKRFIYSGPYIPGGSLIPGGIYIEIPDYLQDIFDKVPEIKELFVDDKQYPEFKKDVKIQGTEAHRLYHYVERSVREGALKDGSK